MKTKYLIPALVLLVASSGVVYGQEASAGIKVEAQGTANIQVRDRDGKLRNIKVPIINKTRASSSANPRERISVNIAERASRLVARFEAAINRERSLLGRINSRLDKFEAEGVDVSATAALSAAAEVKVTAANDALTLLKTKLSAVASAEDPKAAAAEARVQSQATVTALKSAHEAIVKTIASLKLIVK